MANNDFNVLTQFICKNKASDIPIRIYTLPVGDFESRHEEYGNLSYMMRKKNENDLIVFYENMIGSFTTVQDLCGADVKTSEMRPIDPNNERERALLERLIKRELFFSAEKERYERVGNDCLHFKRPVFQDGSVVIYKKITLECNIDTSGRICVALGLSHDFERAITLDRDLESGNVKEGDLVKDIFHGITYNFQSVANFTIGDKNDYLGQSIIEYYQKKGEDYVIKGLSEDTRPVLVLTRARRGKKAETFPYLANRLRKVVRIEGLPFKAKNVFKLTTDQKMKDIVEVAVRLSYSAPHVVSGPNRKEHNEFIKRSMICENQGYSVKDFTSPYLLFGNGQSFRAGYGAINNAMKSIGPYKKSDKVVEIRYFIDHTLLDGDGGAGNKLKLIALTSSLEGRAKMNGVTLEHFSIDDKSFDVVNMENETSFAAFLKEQLDKGVFKSPTIFMLSDKHLAINYRIIKKVLGGQGGITSQCVNFDKVSNTQGPARDAYITNILLGIYAKSGIQSWALRDSLYSDCFVGLDVSRENGVDKGAFVQVIGRDGVIVSTKVVAASQSGEAIADDTMREIFLDAIEGFKNYYGQQPRHITFHRDGRCFENLDVLEALAKELDVRFDYVEVTKTFCARMATFGVQKGKNAYGSWGKEASDDAIDGRYSWYTVFGRVYLGHRDAYLTTTDPKEKIGMAIPVKITQLTSDLDIEKIASDVWNLSFMHVHSLPKTRLPITTYYADLCSTFGVRDWIPTDTNDVLFFV